MTTPVLPTTPEGGAAIPVKVVTDTERTGGAAIPVYGYPGLPTDGRSIAGKPPLLVKVIHDADLIINGGTYWIEGRAALLPVSSLPVTHGGLTASEGNVAVPIYVVSGSL